MYHPTNLEHVSDANETVGEINPLHELQEQREREWSAFQAVMRPHMDAIIDTFHGALVAELGDGMTYDAFADFRDDEGWPNVLRALARAMEQP